MRTTYRVHKPSIARQFGMKCYVSHENAVLTLRGKFRLSYVVTKLCYCILQQIKRTQ